MSDTEESAWITDGPLQGTSADFPLQYSAIFAECQPTNGHVSLVRLNQILNRAGTPNELSAQILATVADPDSQDVSEPNFFWALAHAAALQTNGDHELPAKTDSEASLPLPAQISELRLSDVVEPHIFELENNYSPAAEYSLQVILHKAEAGSYFSRHSLFTVEGVFKQENRVKCVHRFRDFSDLHDVLVEKYPFRAVPVLPPKRLALNGKYLVESSQANFLQSRARGLTRFLHLVVHHPVFNRDPTVLGFLMVKPLASVTTSSADADDGAAVGGQELLPEPSSSSSFLSMFSLTSSRKVQDELHNQTASPLFISQWDDSILTQWGVMYQEMLEQLQHVQQISASLSRQNAMYSTARANSEALGRSSLALARSLEQVYPSLQEDLPEIKSKMERLSVYASSEADNFDSDSKTLELGPLEEIKLYKDMLSSVIELFHRYKHLSKNTIPEQKKRIQSAQRKLASLATASNSTEEELHHQRTIIQTAQADIRSQTNRDWLIKMVMQQEVRTLQSMQYQLSRFLRSLARVESSSLQGRTDVAAKFYDDVSEVPVSRR